MKFPLLLLTLVVSCYSSLRHGSENDGVFQELLEEVAKRPEMFEEAIQKLVPDYVAPMTENPLVCGGCMTLIGGAKALIDAGHNYTSARGTILDFCYGLLNNLSARADLLCPGALDIYGPHVFFILKHRNRTTEYSCEKLLACEPETDDVQQPSSITYAELPKHQKTSSAQTLTIAHVTDIHTDPEYAQGAAATECGTPVCCRRRYNGEGLARRWGEYDCNLPHRTAEIFIRAIGRMNPKPDFVIYAGDNPPHALWEETYEIQLRETQWLVNAFKRMLPSGSVVYPAIGNHEVYPTNLYYIPNPDIGRFHQDYITAWNDLARFGNTSRKTIEAAGYYTELFKPGLRIVNYNTNYGYVMNWYNLINDERSEVPEMFRWLNGTLAAARRNGEKVIMIGHHPPGSDMTYYSGPMSSIMKDFGDIIALMVHGHTHRDEFKVGTAGGSARFVGNVGGTAGTHTGNNPMARLYTLDASTFQLQDYQQYYLRLQNQTDAEPEIELAYSCKAEYGLSDMSPASFLDLTQRMKTDDTLFQKFRRNQNGRANEPGECDEECKKEEICKLKTITIGEYRACVKN